MFDESSTRRITALSAVIDLEGFTTFCRQPDNHTKLAQFLNFTFEVFNSSFRNLEIDKSILHFKFLGDGGLYIWELPNEPNKCKEVNKKLVLALHNLFRVYPTEALDVADDHGRGLPRRLRIGIAQGELSELSVQGNEDIKEYIGFSINMAARLQKYCSQIGFLISQTVLLPDEFLEDYSLIKASTKKITGMDGVLEDVRYVKEDAVKLAKREITKWFKIQADTQ